jgi:hypothetical protein
MKVHVNIDQQGLTINETFTGNSPDEIVAVMKSRVARELPFALRLAVGAMSNLIFAQEVVKRYNQSQKLNLPIPASCDAFLQLAQEQGFATQESA